MTTSPRTWGPDALRRFWRVPAAAALMVLLLPGSAGGATIDVSTTADEFNSGPASCSLREAIWSANHDLALLAPGCGAGSGSDVVAVPAGAYELGIPGRGEQGTASGDLDVTAPVLIQHRGIGSSVVDADGIDRVFEINAPAGAVTISGLVIQGGHASGAGAGMCGSPAAAGGGILVTQGALAVKDSTLVGNRADSFGGGIETGSTGTSNLVNVTVSGNRAGRDGGGVDTTAGRTTLINATVTGNVADSQGECHGGGGIGSFGGATVTLRSSIVAGNSERRGRTPDCFNDTGGVLASLGQTLVGNPTGCGYSAGAGDISGVDPKLGSLADNGGPTPTHALLSSSPALDKGAGCAKTDQRGVPRVGGGTCDIGAYELVRCHGRVANRVGTNDADVVAGTPGRDAFLLLGGNDKAFGLGGSDSFCGGSGRDRAVGGPGNDRAYGDTGKDKLIGRAGDDLLFGGGGDDLLRGGAGDDSLRGDGSEDSCDGGAGGDSAAGCEQLSRVP
jgi:CSLREA domain-containing protein